MDYLLFTYPNCSKCEAFKGYLKGTTLDGQELSLVERESKLRLRECLDLIRRDDKGAIILPVFVLRENGKTVAVFHDQLEFERWLKSRA